MQKFNIYEVEIDRTIKARAIIVVKVRVIIISSKHERSFNSSVESQMLKDKFYCQLVLLCYFFNWNTKRVPLVYTVCYNVNVVVNFFISGNFYFSFVSTLLAYITIQNKRKTKITWDKKLTAT